MALVTAISEIKPLYPKLVSNLSEGSLLPNFERAEYKYLVPITGLALYNDIHTKYNTTPGTMTADEKKLLSFMRLVVIPHAFKDNPGLVNVMIGDNGVKRAGNPDNRIYEWELKNLVNTLMTGAADGAEVLLNFLFEKQFALWIASDEYKKIKPLLIRTGTDFNEHYALHQPTRTYWSIRPVINDVQEMYLVAGIGADLLKYLVELASPNDTLKRMIALLKKATAFLTIKHCCKQYAVRFDDNGFTIAQNNSTVEESRSAADGSSIDLKINDCEEWGQAYLAKARNELVAYYTDAAAPAEYKTAFATGPLINYVQPADRTYGNENRKIFVL